MLTRKILEAVQPETVLASGITENSPSGVYMNDDGGLLRWVAVRGYGYDWALYVGKVEEPVDMIARYGYKIRDLCHIRNCVACDNESLSLYRR